MESILASLGFSLPQTQAAVLQGLLSLIGIVATGVFAVLTWRRNHSADRRRQQEMRTERIGDYCTALRAELESDLRSLQAFDSDEILKDVERQYEKPGYSVFVPHLAPNVIFAAITDELHILPRGVIDAVVDYQRQRETIASFVTDMRDETFPALPSDRQLDMFRGYVEMRTGLVILAIAAAAALDGSGHVQ